MWSLIWKWLADNYPLILVFAVIAWSTWKISEIYHRFRKTEADCHKIEHKIVPQLSAINSSLNSLVIFLGGKHTDMDKGLFMTKSPVQLTDLGTEILNAMGGKTYIDNNANYLISLLEKEPIKSALDVENYAKIVLLREYNSDAFTAIKNYIFQHPVYKNTAGSNVTLDTSTVSNVMGVYLRDVYFMKHPELKNAGA